MIYGYCRISRKTQSIERQVRNILKEYPEAKIIQEAFTGTKIQGRKEFEKLIERVSYNDTIVFDSVSRMSRNAEEGIELYFKLLDNGVNLVFLKEHYIDTDIYIESLKDKIELTGTDEDEIFIGLNNYFRKLAKKQIQIAFEQSEKEVQDLHQRTKEGIETARLNGKTIGRPVGSYSTSKKALAAKEIILTHNKDFGGTLSNEQTIILAGISRMTFFKYKKEIIEEHSR